MSRRHGLRRPIPQTTIPPRKSARARALVNRSGPVKDTLAARYLASRGLILPDDSGLFDPGSLRFAPDAWHWPTHSRLPAIVAPIAGITTGTLHGVHLTFLATDGAGKATVDKPRLYYGTQGRRGPENDR